MAQSLIEMTSRIAGKTQNLLRDETGTTAIEYAIIAGGIGIVIAAAVMALGTVTQGLFERVENGFK